VSFLGLVWRSILRPMCPAARTGVSGSLLVGLLAVFGPGNAARGEIVSNLQPVYGAPGVFLDSLSHSIADINAAGGILIGNELFDSFTVTGSSSPGIVAPTAGSIQITGVEINGDYGFKVNASWMALGQQWVDSTITFRASFVGGPVAEGHGLNSADVYMTAVAGTTGSGAIASISEDLYPTYPGFGDPPFADEFVYYAGSANKRLHDTAAFVPVTSMWVVKDIGVSGGGSATGAMGLSEFYETFGQLPEPSAFVLAGIGVAGLVAAHSCRKGKRG
jgi:hypothetical protein